MKKLSLLYSVLVVVAISCCLYTACKKPLHSNAPTPNNVRLLSYTATTRVNTVIPALFSDTVNNNYSFFYDASNRVTKIIYSTSDTTAVRLGKASENITFYYSNDTIIKTISSLSGVVFEMDTVIMDLVHNLVNTTFTPGKVTNYGYYGKLLANQGETFYNGGTNITENRIYNSDNGDFLDYSFNGTLNITFPSSMTISPYAMRDYWIASNGTTVHQNVTYNDELTNYYSGLPLYVFAKDTANDTSSIYFPGNDIWPSQTYTFYTTMAHRTGDFLQLGSYTLWGQNLYQNNHLVKSITNNGYTTNITYSIDAYSKITQMTVAVIDSVANTKTTTYNLQYESYPQ